MADRPPDGTGADDDPWAFHDLIESTAHASVVVDATGTILYASPMSAVFLGAPGRTVCGMNVLEFVLPESHRVASEAWTWVVDRPGARGRPVELHLTHTGRRVIEVEASELAPGAPVAGVALTLRDVTRDAMEEEIAESVMRSDPIDATLDLIVQLAREQLRGGAAVVVYEAHDGGFERAVHRGASVAIGRACTRIEGPTDGSPWARAIRSGALEHQPVADLGDATLRGHLAELGLEGCFAAPLVNSLGEKLGCLVIWTPDLNRPAPGEVKYLELLAEIAGFALDRWNRDLQLAHRARHDVLTGLPNRLRLHEDVSLTAADGQPAALLLVDLDGFKTVNDEAGHLAGDTVLVTIADRFRTIVREGDLLCRLGGDEFAVLCPVTACTDTVADICERLISAACESVDTWSGPRQVGASVGVRIGALDQANLSTALAEADAAMYRSKAMGGRRWSLAGPPGHDGRSQTGGSPGTAKPAGPVRTDS